MQELSCLWGYFPSVPVRLRIRAVCGGVVCLAESDQFPKRVTVATQNLLYQKKNSESIKKISRFFRGWVFSDLAGQVFHRLKFPDNFGTLVAAHFHVVEHLGDHFADRFHGASDLLAVFHLA